MKKLIDVTATFKLRYSFEMPTPEQLEEQLETDSKRYINGDEAHWIDSEYGLGLQAAVLRAIEKNPEILLEIITSEARGDIESRIGKIQREDEIDERIKSQIFSTLEEPFKPLMRTLIDEGLFSENMPVLECGDRGEGKGFTALTIECQPVMTMTLVQSDT